VLTVPVQGGQDRKFNGDLVGTDNRGTFRVMAWGIAPFVMNNQLQISAYAFQTTTNQYLFYTPRQANQGGQNSW
jgi:hypothetical protein